MGNSLDRKIALVTGGNSGIRLATAQKFVEEGAFTFITGRRQAELDAACTSIGRNVVGIRADIANLADLDKSYEQFATIRAGSMFSLQTLEWVPLPRLLQLRTLSSIAFSASTSRNVFYFTKGATGID